MLIGGRSARFGTPKATALVGGLPMAEVVARRLDAARCSPVVFVGGSATEIEALRFVGRLHFADRWPHEGPLGGVVTALLGLGGDVVVAACDLADLDVESVRRVADHPDCDIALGVCEGVRRPLGRWNRSALPTLLEAFTRGRRSLLGPGLDGLGLAVREVPVVAAGVVDHNTPDELVAQGRLIGSGTVTAMIPEIDTDALAGALEGGSARLFDVREADEFEAGHVPGARSLPLSELPERLGELAGDGPTYLICGIGARSLRACEIASLAGVETINVAGGTRSWVESGRPIVVGDQ